jgi:hypothetical protein
VAPAAAQVAPAAAQVAPAAAQVAPAVPQVVPAVPQVVPAVPQVAPAVPQVAPAVPQVAPLAVPQVDQAAEYPRVRRECKLRAQRANKAGHLFSTCGWFRLPTGFFLCR